MKIIKIVHEYRKIHNGKKSPDFNSGFNECLNLFELGLAKEGLINQGMLLDENDKLKSEISNLKIKNHELREQHNKELEELKTQISALKTMSIPITQKETATKKSLKKYRLFVNTKNLHGEFSRFCQNI